LQATAWVCAADDPAPSLRLRLERPLRTRAILISPADATLETRGWHDRVVRLALHVNGEREAIELVAPENPLDPIRYEFERAPRLRELELRVLEREPGGRRAGLVGFAEVALLSER